MSFENEDTQEREAFLVKQEKMLTNNMTMAQ